MNELERRSWDSLRFGSSYSQLLVGIILILLLCLCYVYFVLLSATRSDEQHEIDEDYMKDALIRIEEDYIKKEGRRRRRWRFVITIVQNN